MGKKLKPIFCILDMQHLCSKDFIKPCSYNEETKNQLWMSEIADSHDIWCSCNTPFAHLLASIFPPGHQDRCKSIQEILERDYKQLCHSGGTEERNLGMALALEEDGEGDGQKEEKEEYIKDEELEQLIAAGEDAATR